VQVPEHARRRDKRDIEPAAAGLVAEGLREVRFPPHRRVLESGPFRAVRQSDK
jgi:hypothetical protein